MNIEFTPNEARVIGCLIEKEITTPDQYPLSLNALTNACNQKTNREPVLELSESEVQQTLDSLMKKYMVSDKSAGYGGRVTKYRHRFCNTEFGPLKFSAQELGTLCVMLLRGPQTPGELAHAHQPAVRISRMPRPVESTLQALMTREDGPFVARLPRAPGARESRYTHLFFGAVESAPDPGDAPVRSPGGERRHGVAHSTVSPARSSHDGASARDRGPQGARLGISRAWSPMLRQRRGLLRDA